jgi:multimeric flavodoxin WrbA
MKILGISGSARSPQVSGVYKLVKTVLDASGCDYELVSLRGKNIGGCTGCLACVKDNVCKLKDDMAPLRDKIAEADAYVIGAPNYYSGINARTHALLERLYQFRHLEGNLLWGKLAVAVGVGGTSKAADSCCDEIKRYLAYSFIYTIAEVSGQGAASCYTCGYGETCKLGVLVMVYGEGVKIRQEDIPDVTKQPLVLSAAVEAGILLGKSLSQGYDRKEVTAKLQKRTMKWFRSST